MAIRVEYEWAIEEIDGHGDILEVYRWGSPEEALDCWRQLISSTENGLDFALVRCERDAGDFDDLVEASYAYFSPILEDLPNEVEGHRVPAYIRRAWEKALNADR